MNSDLRLMQKHWIGDCGNLLYLRLAQTYLLSAVMKSAGSMIGTNIFDEVRLIYDWHLLALLLPRSCKNTHGRWQPRKSRSVDHLKCTRSIFLWSPPDQMINKRSNDQQVMT